MSENKFTLDAFVKWCRTRGNNKYQYTNAQTCACAQYSEHVGRIYDPADPDPYGNFAQQIEYYARELLRKNIDTTGKLLSTFNELADFVETRREELKKINELRTNTPDPRPLRIDGVAPRHDNHRNQYVYVRFEGRSISVSRHFVDDIRYPIN